MKHGETYTKTILLVEDDPKDEQLTLAALGEHGLADRVTVVHDGVEALDYLFRRNHYKTRTGHHPAVVLLDNKMPRLNGLEVLKSIKADEGLKNIPVVVFSSSSGKAEVAEFYRWGVNAYLVKPAEFGDFVHVMRHFGAFWMEINLAAAEFRPKASAVGQAGAGQVNGTGMP